MELENKKTSVHDGGKYGDIQWHKIELDPNVHSFMSEIYSFLGAEKDGICVFYYLSPGAVLHPHRDLTGASSNARIRFHVPIITNEKFFNVSKQRVIMAEGELWALDTSYLHEVKNESDFTRVHIVIECPINKSVSSRLPAKIWLAGFMMFIFLVILLLSFIKSVFINVWKDPKYFLAQMRMIKKFVSWRVFGKKM